MTNKPAIWVDFENAPHVWVLSLLVNHFQNNGYRLIMTARDFSYTVGLCRRMGYDIRVIGPTGSGKGKVTKAWRVLDRASRLLAYMAGQRKDVALAISHGSRSQTLAAHYLGIRSVSLDDYEFSDQSLVRFVTDLLVPFPIPKENWGPQSTKVTHYPGLKEELYLCEFKPDNRVADHFHDSDSVNVLFRAESRTSHYSSEQSEVLQRTILDRVADHPGIMLTLLPRDPAQSKMLADYCDSRGIRYRIPKEILDGPSLIWNMDLVLSGGGTMVREGAVLGVPSYSFFAGEWGAVDRYLETQHRLVRIATPKDVDRISLRKNERGEISISHDALAFVTGFMDDRIVRRVRLD